MKYTYVFNEYYDNKIHVYCVCVVYVYVHGDGWDFNWMRSRNMVPEGVIMGIIYPQHASWRSRVDHIIPPTTVSY